MLPSFFVLLSEKKNSCKPILQCMSFVGLTPLCPSAHYKLVRCAAMK